MKKKRTLIAMLSALVVIVLVFVGLMIWQDRRETPGDETTPTGSSNLDPLIRLEREDVSEIVITNEEGTVRIKNETVQLTPTPSPTPDPSEEEPSVETEDDEDLTEDRWMLVEPEISSVDQATVDSTANGLLTFTIIEDITEEAGDDLAVYGIDEPQASVTYQLKDGSDVVIRLGNQLQGERSYYAYSEDSERLALVTSPVNHLLRTAGEFVTTQIFPFADVNVLREFDFYRANDDVELTLVGVPYSSEAEGEEEAAETTESEQTMPPVWNVTSPIEWEANQNNVPALLTELATLVVNEQVSLSQDDLEQYGLDEPSYIITLGDGEESVTLTIGNALGDGTSYGVADGIDGVFTVNLSALSKIGMPTIDFFNGFVALESIWTVGEIYANLDGKEYDIEVFSPSQDEKAEAKEAGEDEPQTIYLVNGRNANIKDENDKGYFSAFYQGLIGVMGRGTDFEAEPELVDPQFSFEFIKRDGSEDVRIDLTPRTERTWYIFKNGEYTGLYTDYNDLYGYRTVNSMGLTVAAYRLDNAIAGQQSGIYEHPPMDPETGETLAPDDND